MAHPRSRGENRNASSAPASATGSSPLTRGKLSSGHDGSFQRGLIPAHAGKTGIHRRRYRWRRAHPRSRGENGTQSIGSHAHVGSSPLTRGKRYSVHRLTCACGFIPAHAGKTACHPLTQGRRGAHPRSREENIDAWKLPERHVGSSPLTRGKRYSVHRLTCACGFIPAHAGKTSHDPAHQSASTAHPRSRRENDLTEPIMELMPGSSPLTRGKLDRAAGPGQVVGLIPAHAGKTSCSVEPLGSVGAHPRSRGENGGTRSLRIPARGSSPLTRGKPPGRP